MFLDLIEASYAMRWMGLVTLTAMAPVAWHRFQWHRRWLARGELEVEPARQDDLYSVPHDVVEAYVREFPGLDQGFYERIKNILQGKGLRWMGELEDRTWSRLLPGLRTCARVFINGSGEVTATATHPSGTPTRTTRTCITATGTADWRDLGQVSFVMAGLDPAIF